MDELFDFGTAIKLLKEGKLVARNGWNGKQMHVYLEKGRVDKAAQGFPSNINGVNINLFDAGPTGTITRNPCLCMFSAQGNIIPGWIPSQTDQFAEDWCEVKINYQNGLS